MSLLSVQDLCLRVENWKESFIGVDGLSFEMQKGEILGIVGESGSGKSLTAKAILGLLGNHVKACHGCIKFNDVNLLKLPEKKMQSIRGNQISMIFQDPMTALNPTMKIGKQIAEPLQLHYKLSKKAVTQKVIELLNWVKIPDPEKRLHQYPHQFSGGMRQRALIAMALACSPQLIIADEPTTALDPHVQLDILKLLQKIRDEKESSILLITHDLHLVKDICDRVLVMYCGKLCEIGDLEEVFFRSKHPYTQGLLNSFIADPNLKRLPSIPGSPPDLKMKPSGCPFYPRCHFAMNICKQQQPILTNLNSVHASACWLNQKQTYEADSPSSKPDKTLQETSSNSLSKS